MWLLQLVDTFDHFVKLVEINISVLCRFFLEQSLGSYQELRFLWWSKHEDYHISMEDVAYLQHRFIFCPFHLFDFFSFFYSIHLLIFGNCLIMEWSYVLSKLARIIHILMCTIMIWHCLCMLDWSLWVCDGTRDLAT